MALLPSSQITFLYVDRLPEAAEFFDRVLCLEQVFGNEWSRIWRAGVGAFVGIVQTDQGSISVTQRGGTLVSLTVEDLDAEWARLSAHRLECMTEIKQVKAMGLRSFFFTGPQGYAFELQQFTDPALQKIFHQSE